MNDDKRRNLDELDAEAREQDRRYQERMFEQLDEYLAPAADAISDEFLHLAKQLAELGLIDEEDDPGRYRYRADLGIDDQVVGWEVDHPEPRLYAFHPGTDTIIATRMPDDGRYEHAVLDEHGLPIERRAAFLVFEDVSEMLAVVDE
jgi:hypothetical protein